jgi:hypothetical protein
MARDLKKGSVLFVQPHRITTEFDPRGWASSPTRGWWFLDILYLTWGGFLGPERVGAEPY